MITWNQHKNDNWENIKEVKGWTEGNEKYLKIAKRSKIENKYINMSFLIEHKHIHMNFLILTLVIKKKKIHYKNAWNGTQFFSYTYSLFFFSFVSWPLYKDTNLKKDMKWKQKDHLS